MLGAPGEESVEPCRVRDGSEGGDAWEVCFEWES